MFTSFQRFFFIFSASFFSYADILFADELKTKAVKLEFSITKGGEIPLNQPTAVSVGSDNRIYVLDGVNNRVAIFDIDGKYLFSFGSEGSGKGEFNLPVGMTLDKNNDVYVADTRNHRIQVFNSEGKFNRLFKLSGPPAYTKPDPTALLIVNNEL